MTNRSTRSLLFTSLLAVCITAFSLVENPAFAGDGKPVDSTSRLQHAVLRMNSWLNGSGQAEGWRRYLQLNVLDTQSALGDQADVATLMKLHRRFSFSDKGLQHPAFADVRNALQAQIGHLGLCQNLEPFDALNRARNQYRQISIQDLKYQRDSVLYELNVLAKYYRSQDLSSRDRADLFYDLQLYETVDFLEGIEFELPPEFSVGKTDSMLRDVRKQLKDVIEKIDAIPSTPEPDEDEGDEAEQDETSAVEGEIAPILDILGPEPDDGNASKEDLEAEQKKLEAQIDTLKEQRSSYLKKDGPRRRDRKRVFDELLKIERTFGDFVNTESNPYFVSAAVSIEEFSRTFFFATSDNLQEQYLRKLEELSKQLSGLQGGDVRTSAGEVGSTLGWLENANQAPELVTAIRVRYSLPNAYFALSSRMINQIAGQTIDQTRSLNEPIDGRQVRGSASLNGTVSIDLQDDPNQVHASIHFMGTLQSQTMLRERKIRAFVGANGVLEARRSVFANLGGLFANDTYGAANVEAFFLGTSSKLNLVNKIAGKKFAKEQTKSEGYAARTAENQLIEQIGEQTDEAFANGADALGEAQASAYAKANLLPQVYLRSARDRIHGVGKKSSLSTLAAQNRPSPPFATDLSVTLHDSFLSNYLDATFSNKTFTDKELQEELSSLMGTPGGLAAPETEKDGDEEDQSFSITFAQVRPIEFQFEGNRISIVVSGRRFAQAGRRINEGLRIILRFKIKRIDGKLKLTRDGKAELEFLDTEKKTPRTVAFKSFLESRLNPKEGGQEISIDLEDNLIPVDQIEGLKNPQILKDLKLALCSAENGWLYLGWNYQPAGSYSSSPMSLPAIWTETVISSMDPAYLYQPIESMPPTPVGATLDLNPPVGGQ